MSQPLSPEARHAEAMWLLSKVRNDSITLDECYTLRQWIEDIRTGRLSTTEEIKLLVALASWSVQEKIAARERRRAMP
jgi:hypothetical protein